MRITVVKAAPNMWYSNMVGQTFEVLKPNNLVYVFSSALFFNADDVKEETTKTGLVTFLDFVALA